MSRIRNKDTKPEVEFRKYIWNQGLKGYRIYKAIKGKPDLYFPKKQVAVFIDGCFWHQCPICFKKPKTNKKFWNNKIKQNVKRDLDTDIFLANQGIHVLRLWEHEIKIDLKGCVKKLKKLLK